jgi:hypothetical protein
MENPHIYYIYNCIVFGIAYQLQKKQTNWICQVLNLEDSDFYDESIFISNNGTKPLLTHEECLKRFCIHLEKIPSPSQELRLSGNFLSLKLD